MMIPGLESLLDSFASLEPRQKLGIKIGGLALVIIVVVTVFSTEEAVIERIDTSSNVSGVFKVEDKDVTIDGLATKVANLQEKLNLATQQNAANAAAVSQLTDTLQGLSNSDTNLKNIYEISRKLKLLENQMTQIATQPTRQVMNQPSPIDPLQQLTRDNVGNLILPDDEPQSSVNTPESPDFPSLGDPEPDQTVMNEPLIPPKVVPERMLDPINNTPSKFKNDKSYEFLLNSNSGVNDALGLKTDDEAPLFIDSAGVAQSVVSNKINMITHVKDQSPSVINKKKSENYYIPKRLLPGSLIPVVLITGTDSPTGSKSSENVVSSTFRVSGPAIMPNGRRVDLTGCYIIAQSKGDLSTERVYFRPDVISCELPIGQVKSTLKGYITGRDGVQGIRGRVVSRQSEVLKNAMLAGAIEGLSNVFGGGSGNSRSQGNIFTGGDPYALPDTDVATKAATTSALSGATAVLQEYYRERLEALYTIIEVRALIPGSLHLLEDVTIELLEPIKPQKLTDPMEELNNEQNTQNQRSTSRNRGDA
jgi:hypothetical protein